MPCKQSNTLVYDAIKERGRLSLVAFRELSERYGEAEAISVMRSVSHTFGTTIGESLACFAPRDFAGMAEGYAKSPDNGATFLPDIRHLDDTCLEVQMMTCPIKDSWVEAGCSDDEICTLLHCTRPQDEATFEAAGFAYELEQWSPGKMGCCHAKLTEKSQP
jgi:hypothetical protein